MQLLVAQSLWEENSQRVFISGLVDVVSVAQHCHKSHTKASCSKISLFVILFRKLSLDDRHGSLHEGTIISSLG